MPFSVFCRHSRISASEWLCCWESWSVVVSLTFVFHSVPLNDGCLGKTGVFPSASLAYCRRAYKAVQPACWKAAVPELSVGLKAHRSVCLTLSLSFFRSICSAPVAPSLCYCVYSEGTVLCFVSALDCTAPHSLVSRHWNRQAFLCGWGWVDLLLMWMDRLDCLQPLQSLSLNIIISDAVQVWSALLSLDKVTC